MGSITSKAQSAPLHHYTTSSKILGTALGQRARWIAITLVMASGVVQSGCGVNTRIDRNERVSSTGEIALLPLTDGNNPIDPTTTPTPASTPALSDPTVSNDPVARTYPRLDLIKIYQYHRVFQTGIPESKFDDNIGLTQDGTRTYFPEAEAWKLLNVFTGFMGQQEGLHAIYRCSYYGKYFVSTSERCTLPSGMPAGYATQVEKIGFLADSREILDPARNPVEVRLCHVRPVGDEFYWPAGSATNVFHGFWFVVLDQEVCPGDGISEGVLGYGMR